jgi:hypothetical protein
MSLAVCGCQAKLGERCDGFFTNTCESGGACVKMDDGAICAKDCNPKFGDKCTEGFECKNVTFKGAAVGGKCVPNAMPAK